jgi:HK97 gp10 family phage protein
VADQGLITVKVEGLKEIQAKLAALPLELERHAVRKALKAAGEVVALAVQEPTPVDTGLLASSVQTTESFEKQQARAYVGFGRQSYVARWIEFGFRLLGHKPKKKFIKQIAPHPFMRQAYEESANKAVDTFAEVMRVEAEKAAKKASK